MHASPLCVFSSILEYIWPLTHLDGCFFLCNRLEDDLHFIHSVTCILKPIADFSPYFVSVNQPGYPSVVGNTDPLADGIFKICACTGPHNVFAAHTLLLCVWYVFCVLLYIQHVATGYPLWTCTVMRWYWNYREILLDCFSITWASTNFVLGFGSKQGNFLT